MERGGGEWGSFIKEQSLLYPDCHLLTCYIPSEFILCSRLDPDDTMTLMVKLGSNSILVEKMDMNGKSLVKFNTTYNTSKRTT